MCLSLLSIEISSKLIMKVAFIFSLHVFYLQYMAFVMRLIL